PGNGRPGNGRAASGQAGNRPGGNGQGGNGRAGNERPGTRLSGNRPDGRSQPLAATPDPLQSPDADLPEVNVPVVDAPAVEPDFSALTPDLSEQLVVGAPLIPAAVLSERLAAATTARANWQQEEDQKEQQRQAVNCYVAWGALGEAVTFVDRGAAESQPHLKAAQRLLAELGGDAEQVAALGTLGTKWIRSANRANRGAFLAGTVQSVAPHGSLFEVRLVLEGDAQEQPLAVLLRDDPGGALAVGRQMLVLGAIVTDPELNLSGYTGSEPLVVVAGTHDVVPESTPAPAPASASEEPPATPAASGP
ncbi:MAG: hypothetical protein J5I93_21890, partial [Pirellulaceae bacterium]|nr:hypothetical protein [Pirellulaceae bacterium]